MRTARDRLRPALVEFPDIFRKGRTIENKKLFGSELFSADDSRFQII